MARCDIQKNELVRSFRFVALSDLDWIAGVSQIDEIRSFDNPSLMNVEAWNNAFRQHFRPRIVQLLGDPRLAGTH